MRVAKFITTTGLITSLCLLYVYQQTEIFRLAYVRQKQMGRFEELLDKNSLLRYNIQRHASLVQIGEKVLADAGLQMPVTYRLVKVAPASRVTQTASSLVIPRPTLLSRLFGITRQAEAMTLNQ